MDSIVKWTMLLYGVPMLAGLVLAVLAEYNRDLPHIKMLQDASEFLDLVPILIIMSFLPGINILMTLEMLIVLYKILRK